MADHEPLVAMGLETEMGLIGLGRQLRHRDRAARLLVERVAASQPCARGGCDKHRDTVFLANGAAFGLDPPWPTIEYCTPECLDPFELAASLRAGMRLVMDAAGHVETEFQCRVMPVAASYFHFGAGITLGTHENYGVRCTSEEVMRQVEEALLTWLICRQLLTEPGILAPGSLISGFALAPRAHLMAYVSGTSTTRGRAIFTRGRGRYARGSWRRLHLICAGATLSPWAVAIRHGGSALLIKMCVRGWRLPPALRIREPLTALRRVSQRPEVAIETAGGRLTALELLVALCAEARSHHAGCPLAEWGDRLLAEWQRGIELWQSGGSEAEFWLEAPLKRRIFQHYLKKEGATWDQTRLWAHVLHGVRTVFAANEKPLPLSARAISKALPRSARRSFDLLLQREGLTWEDFPRFQRIVDRLHVLDIELSRISGGLADRQVECRQRLGVEVVAESDVERLRTEPPRTRARARGRLIRRHAVEENLRACWDLVTTSDSIYRLTSPAGWRMPGKRERHDRGKITRPLLERMMPDG